MSISISKKILGIALLFSQFAFASPPVIWNGADAKFLNSGSVKIPGLAGVGCAQFDVNGKLTNTGGACGSGAGTVTSVSLTAPAFLSVAGSPVTSSGTLALSLSGTALPVANGGTGNTSFTSTNQLILGGTTTTGALQQVAAGTSGQVLQSNGASAPTWITPSYNSAIGVQAHGAFTGGSGAGSTIIWGTVDYDSSAAYNNTTGVYTAPTGGIYNVSGFVNATNTNTTVAIYVNGTRTPASFGSAGGTFSSAQGTFVQDVKVNSGDLITVRSDANLGTGGGSNLNIHLVAGGGSNTGSTGTGNFHIEFFKFGGATEGTNNCTSSPCSIKRQTGGISSVTRSAGGVYVINFTAGTFSGAPTCVATGVTFGVGACSCYNNSNIALPTSTTFGLNCGADCEVTVSCMGPN